MRERLRGTSRVAHRGARRAANSAAIKKVLRSLVEYFEVFLSISAPHSSAASYARAMAAGPSFEGYYSNANPEHVNKVWAAAASPKASLGTACGEVSSTSHSLASRLGLLLRLGGWMWPCDWPAMPSARDTTAEVFAGLVATRNTASAQL